MASEIETSLVIEFEELFGLRDRLRPLADRLRAVLYSNGLFERLETEVFDEELELRVPEGSRLVIRLDSYHLEITGAPLEMQLHLLASLILEEAEVFRLAMVEAGFSMGLTARRGNRLNLVEQAFSTVGGSEGQPMLDRRFSMTWEWGTPTTGYSLVASVLEDRELFLSFKAREGYSTLAELKTGRWSLEQAARFDMAVQQFLSQIGWT